MLKAMFNVCTHNAMKIKEHKDHTNMKLRKPEERQKVIHAHLRIEPPYSPVAFEVPGSGGVWSRRGIRTFKWR